MAEPVIVPVQLEVIDIDTSEFDAKQLQKTVTEALSDVRKSMENVLSGIDMSKANKSILSSVDRMDAKFRKVNKTQSEFYKEAVRAGKSTEGYKTVVADLAEAEKKLKAFNGLSHWYDNNGNLAVNSFTAKQYQRELDAYNKQLADVERLRELVNSPAIYAPDADSTYLTSLESLYNSLRSSVISLNAEAQKFNQTMQNNQTTDEYNKLIKQAEAYKKKLEDLDAKSKRMESLGATDKQWEALKYDTAQVSSALEDIIKQMGDVVSTGKAFRFGNGNMSDIVALGEQIHNFSAAVNSIPEDINQRVTGNQSPYTEDYQKELDNLEKTQKAVEKLNAKYRELQALGKLTPDGLAKLKYEAEQLEKELEDSQLKLSSMVHTGSAFKVGNGDVQGEMRNINARLDESSEKLAEINNATAQTPVDLQGINKLVQSLTKTVNKLAKGFVKAMVGAVSLGKQGKSTGVGLTKVFNKLRRNVLMYGFGFRSAYYAIKRLRNLVIDEFKLMAESSSEINAQVTGLTMAFNTLKGSVGVAFQPLAAVVIPILQTAMNYVSAFLESIGRFIATLTGQGYVYKAIAKNIDSVAESAKEANKQLGSYDKLEVINKDNSDKSNDLGIDYEKVGLDGSSSFAELVKEAWKNQDFTEVGLAIGNKLVEALDNIPWDSIREKAEGLANSIATLINGFFETSDLGQSIGNAIANTLLTAIDFIYTTITTIDFENIGQVVGEVLDTFLTKMAEVDETGLSGWGKLAKSYSGLITGILELLIAAMKEVKWIDVGQAIGDYISSIEWGQVLLDFTALAGQILGGIAGAIAGWTKEDPISAAIMGVLGAAILGLNLASIILPIILKAQVLKKLFGAADALTKGAAAGDAAGTVGKAATTTGKVGTSVSTLTTKLVTLIKNFALGIAVIAEVVAAALLIIAAIWLMGKMLEQVGKAWDPVIENGNIIATAIGIGLLLLAAIGIVTALLGSVGTTLIVNIALGTAILAEISIATDLFLIEIWAIGELLDLIGQAWQPVLDNGETIAIGIGLGTALLVGIGVVTAALGMATVASAGALPLAIGLGTAILVELATAFVLFCESMTDTAEQLQDLAIALDDLIPMLPGLEDNLSTFTTHMTGFADEVINFTKSSAVAGIGATVDKIVGFFTADPVKTLREDIEKRTEEFDDLIPALETIIESITTATDLLGEYKSAMGSFETAASGDDGLLGSIAKGAKGAVNGMIAMFEGLANGVIKAINAIVKAINSIDVDIPKWVPDIGGKSLKFNLSTVKTVTIPRLAQGAVIPPNKEFLAMLGDQKSGTNIEAPLDTIKQALAEVMAEFGGGAREPIMLQVNGRVLAQVVWDEQEKRYKQTGKSMAY